MKSTLFVVCLALALACSNAIGSMGGGGFRGGSSGGSRGGSSFSAPRMSSPAPRISSPSAPRINSAPRISAPAPRISTPVRPSMPKITPSIPRPTMPKINTPPRVTPTIPRPTPRPTPVQTPRPIQTPRPAPVKPTPTPVKPHVPVKPVVTPVKPQVPVKPVVNPVKPQVPVKPTPVQTPKPTTPIQTPKPTTPVVNTPKPTTPTPAGGLSVQQLQKMMPQAKSSVLNQYAPYLNQAMKDAGINTPARQNAFLAQLGHESGQFKYMQELASGKAYEGRKDLGNTSPGDGVKYKGRGPIQITGKANYAAAGKALGIDLVNHPELASTPEVGFKTAAWFWNKKGLNAKADAGHFSDITKAINGCANCKQTHAAERNALFANNNKINP